MGGGGGGGGDGVDARVSNEDEESVSTSRTPRENLPTSVDEGGRLVPRGEREDREAGGLVYSGVRRIGGSGRGLTRGRTLFVCVSLDKVMLSAEEEEEQPFTRTR